jgi:DNA-binding transcriptional ArsR family regulator
MTLDERDVQPAARTFVSAPSLGCDLTWVLWVALKPTMPPKIPLAWELLAAHPDLIERIRTFWVDPGSPTCFSEIQMLAHHAGVLEETSPAVFWAAIEEAVATVPTDWPLQSESPEDRAIFIDRLQQLKRSPDLVRSYFELLHDVWDVVDEIWQSALPELEESGRRVVAQLEGGRPLDDVVREHCETFRAWLPDINARVEAGQPLLVVPCLFFGQSMYLELPGLTLVGSGFARDDVAARARTESLARRLKSVADPTRLALLHYLATTPSTVGDLAASFGLAQPTVSMHMKSLRASGLVQSERKDGKVRLSADASAVDSLLDEVRRVVEPSA